MLLFLTAQMIYVSLIEWSGTVFVFRLYDLAIFST